MYNKSLAFRDAHVKLAHNMEELGQVLDSKCFAKVVWNKDPACEAKFKEKFQATVRVMLDENPSRCLHLLRRKGQRHGCRHCRPSLLICGDFALQYGCNKTSITKRREKHAVFVAKILRCGVQKVDCTCRLCAEKIFRLFVWVFLVRKIV